MALTVTIGGSSRTAYMQEGTATLKYNTLDLTLVDPPTIPAIGATVTLTDPTWTGTVSRVRKRTGPRPGHKFITITATNTDEAGASAGPFGLSDSPSPPTTYGYDDLSVETTHNLDASDVTTGTCTIYQTGLWPAMTFNLTSADLGYSATSFSVTDVTVTWVKGTPRYHLSFGDPLVTMSVWLNSESAGILPITRTKITDGEVTTPKLAANSVTAAKLEAVLVLVTKLIAGTAETGVVRVELDSAGITCYSATDEPLVVIPTDGSPVIVKGEITASSLVSTALAELRGANLLPIGSVTTVAGAVEPPTTAPALLATIEQPFSLSPAPTDVLDHGLAWDSGSSTWYGCYWVSGDTSAKIREFNGTTGALIRSVTAGLTTADLVLGIGVSSTHVYVCHINNDTVTLHLRKFLRSDLSYVATANISADATVKAEVAMFYDATADRLVVATTTGTGTGKYVRFRLYDQSLALQSTVSGSTGTTIDGTWTGYKGGVRYNGYYWLDTLKDGTTKAVYCVNLSTGAIVADQDFGWVAGTYRAGQGLGHNGTVFFSIKSDATPTGAVYKFTGWDWTTASAVYWVGYSWYDPDGTTHETDLGPRASITLTRRARLQVNTAPIPGDGTAEAPDNARIYMERGAADPGAGNFKLQATDALTTRYLSTFATGGAADGAGTAFPAGTPGEITSGTAGWKLKGDGTKTGFWRYVGITAFDAAASTTTGDTGLLTCSEMTGLPSTGVVAVQVTVIVNTTVFASSTYAFASDYEDTTGGSVFAWVIAASTNTANTGIVVTGGTNNRQIKYRAVEATTGTLSYYMRVVGYWTTAEA